MTSSEPIVVVGAGLAGLAAAIEAVDAGASKVVIFDKEKNMGGNSAKACSGINGLFSQAQKAQNIQDSVDLFVQDTIASGQGKCDNNLVLLLVQQSSSAIQFLESHGIDLMQLSQCGGHSKPRTHRSRIPETAKPTNVGWDIMSTLSKTIAQKYAKSIEFKYNCKVTSLIRDTTSSTPRILGIHYVENQVDKVLMSQHVILASGGFSADHDLLAKYAPQIQNLPSTNGLFTTGDGIKIVQQCFPSAILLDMNQIQIHPTAFINPENPTAKTLLLAAEALRAHGGMLLNQQGKRFVNELDRRDQVTSAIFKNCIPEIENGPVTCYLVLNQDAVNEFGQNLLNFYKSKKLVQVFPNFTEFAASVKGMSLQELKNTVDKYNSCHDNKVDKDEYGTKLFPTRFEFDKTVYVMRVTPAIHYSMGGLKINSNAQVLVSQDVSDSKSQEVPVQGLYAAGEVTGGVHGACRLGGNSLLECIVFGRIAGRHAVTDNQKK